MKAKFLLSGLIFFLFLCTAWSQERSDFEVVSLKQNYLNAAASKQNVLKHSSGSQVYIQQVGVGNYAHAQVKSEQAFVDYRQEGNYNYISFDMQTPSVENVVHQRGNSNRAFGFMTGDVQSNLHLSQTGNNQHFEQFGSNSIGDKMQLKMSGNTNAVIVRNFQ